MIAKTLLVLALIGVVFSQSGGWSTSNNHNIDSAEYKGIFAPCLTQLYSQNLGFSASEDWSVSKILKVQYQVVAGINYKFVLELTNT